MARDYKGDLAVASAVEGDMPVQLIANGELGMLNHDGNYKGFVPYAQGKFNLDDEKELGFELPKNTKLKVLTGTMAGKMKTLWGAHQVENLSEIARPIKPPLGFDPEFFFEDGQGKLIPAWELFPDKHHPTTSIDGGFTEMHSNTFHFKGYWDGLQAEFSIHNSSPGCMVANTGNLRQGLTWLEEEAKKSRKDARLSFKSTFEVSKEFLLKEPFEHVQFGCEPSLNAYGEKWRDIKNPYDYTLRPAGGHMHFGLANTYYAGYFKDPVKLVKGIDAIAGVASVGLFDGLDDPKRRELYGRAGEYRLPKHGLEYRVFSNQWLMNPTLGYMLMDVTRMAMGIASSGLIKYWHATEQEVQEAINTSNATLARAIMKRNSEMFLQLGQGMWGRDKGPAKKAMSLILKGVKDNKDFPRKNVLDNWNIAETWGGYCAR